MCERFYQYTREVWDEDTCEKIARRYARDGLGTRYPFPGYIGAAVTPPQYGGYGRQRYNGGCVFRGRWYSGAERKLPKVAGGFKIVKVPTWGWRLVKKGEGL